MTTIDLTSKTSSGKGTGIATGLRLKSINRSGINAIRLLCENPLERLCDLLLPWSFLCDYAKYSVNKEKPQLSNTVEPIPIHFESYHHYIQAWTPLIIEEIKANLLANFKLDSRSGSVTLNFGPEKKGSRSGVITLDCVFENRYILSVSCC